MRQHWHKTCPYNNYFTPAFWIGDLVHRRLNDGITGKKIALLCEDYFDDQELIYPLHRMREAGAVVQIVGPGG